jgi:mono/diheme cytochrome c family protein
MFSGLALAAAILPASAQDGHQLFTLYCSACHGVDGKGATGGTFPPLSESPWVAGEADRATKIALKGLTGPVDVLGKTYNLEMPPQGAVLPDDQLAAILTYVRSAWGNQAGAVTPDFVKTVRASVADRNAPWTAGEILKLHPLPFEKTALSNVISQIYSGKWNNMPDFTNLKATNIEEEHNGILSLKNSPFEDNFAKVWQANFTAPAEGDYEFLLDADDAAAVIIDGKTIVEVKGAGPMNGSRAVRGKATLTQGSHKFRAEFLEITDKQGIALGWKGPGDKSWKWLSDQNSKPTNSREPIPIEPVNGRPVIYRNFIAGTTPRAIGVGFPGGLNLAYSADNLAPELIWTGEFMDGAAKWIDRGTDNNPPAGENVVNIGIGRYFENARFKGYKLDTAGNPTFLVKIQDFILSDSWHVESGALVRKLNIIGKGRQNVKFGSNLNSKGTIYSRKDNLTIDIGDAEVWSHKGMEDVIVTETKPATITYRWK